MPIEPILEQSSEIIIAEKENIFPQCHYLYSLITMTTAIVLLLLRLLLQV